MFKFIKNSLALLNTIEGFSHVIIALISFWGIFAIGVFDWRVVSPAAINLFLGLFSIFTGYVIVFNKSKLVAKIIAYLNTIEGAIHIVVAIVGFWGIFATEVFDWRLFATPTEHLIFGLFSILTGYILGESHKHHHH